MVTQSLWVGQPAHGNLWGLPIHVCVCVYIYMAMLVVMGMVNVEWSG